MIKTVSQTMSLDKFRRAQSKLTRGIFAALLVTGLVACSDPVDPAQALKNGEALFASGEYNSAIIELKNAVQGDPENAQARFVLGETYLQVGNPEAALKELTRARTNGLRSDALNIAIVKAMLRTGNTSDAATELAVNFVDSSAQWLGLQGTIDFAAGRYEEAYKALDEAIRKDPNNLETRRVTIRAAIATGNIDRARELIDESLAASVSDADIWQLKGDLDTRDKEFANAVASYTKALELDSSDQNTLLRRAAAHASNQDLELALADLDAIGEASHEDPRALYLRAVIARQQNQPAIALRDLRKVLLLLPTHKNSLEQAAAIHTQRSEFFEAEEYLNRLLAIDPGNEKYRRMLKAIQLSAGRISPEISEAAIREGGASTDPDLLALLGTAYLKSGRISEARESLDRALELNPGSIPIRTQIAFSKMRSANVDEAMDDLAAIRKEDPDFPLAGVLHAFGFAQLKNQVGALQVANEMLDGHPDDPLYYNVRGFLHGAFGDTDKAREDFNKALNINPSFHPANFNLARLAIADGDKEAAASRLKDVLKAAPNEPSALVYLASIRLSDGDTEGAVELWEQARENSADAIQPRVMLARYHRSEKATSIAEEVIDEAYKLAPDAAVVQLEYVLTKLSAGALEEATTVADQLVERYPDSPQILQLRAQIYSMNGDAENLEASLRTIVDRFPSATRSHVALGQIYLSRKEFTEAQKIARGLIAQDELSAKVEGTVMLGDVEFRQKNFTKALTNYSSAHELSPNSRSILKILTAQKALGTVDQALFKQWLETHPDDVDVRVAVAIGDTEEGERSTAIEQYEQVLEADPKNIVALNNLAWLFYEAGDDRALEFGRRAFDTAPNRPEIMDTYGWIMLQRGSREQAVDLLSRAAKSAPANRDIRYHYASGLAMSEDNSAALSELQTILSDDVEFETRADAEALLIELTK